MNQTKNCPRCDRHLPLSQFYKHERYRLGVTSWCKGCIAANVRRWRRANPIRKRQAGRDAYRRSKNTPRYRAAVRKASRAQYKKDRGTVKLLATKVVRQAIINGDLVKPDCCSRCQDKGVHLYAHHDDYRDVLGVRWLCGECHRSWHDFHGPGRNSMDPPTATARVALVEAMGQLPLW